MGLEKLPIRIRSKILVVEECWLWQAGLNDKGYGLCSMTDGKSRLAHRVTYRLLVGPVSVGLELDHTCRNRPCVNPAHLEQVTHLENMRRGVHATKTHCVNGHLLSGANLYLYTRRGSQERRCRECSRQRQRAWKLRKREEMECP